MGIGNGAQRGEWQKGLSHSAFLERSGTEEQCHAALVAWRWPEGFVCPRCGVNYDTAWLLKQKLLGAMQAHNAERPLSGLIQVDGACLGGEATRQPGDKSGRGAPNKLPFLAAVATRDVKPSAIHLRPVTGFTKAAIGDYAARNLAAGSAVVSDGLRCFSGFAEAGLTHVSIRTGSGKRPGEPAPAWFNTVPGNIKAALTGTCRAVRHHHAGRYLAGFEWRFNHRLDLAEILPRLATTALCQHPTPLRFFRTAEADG